MRFGKRTLVDELLSVMCNGGERLDWGGIDGDRGVQVDQMFLASRKDEER